MTLWLGSVMLFEPCLFLALVFCPSIWNEMYPKSAFNQYPCEIVGIRVVVGEEYLLSIFDVLDHFPIYITVEP